MLLENKKELDELMGSYQKNSQKVATEREREQIEHDNFVNSFERLKHEIVWPTVVDVGNELTKYNHDFQVTEEKAYTDATASYHPSQITFSIYPASIDPNYKKPESAPYVQFVADPYAEKVSIVVSTMVPGLGGVLGEHGRYDLDKVDAKLVEKEIVEVLKHTPIFES